MNENLAKAIAISSIWLSTFGAIALGYNTEYLLGYPIGGTAVVLSLWNGVDELF